jgi:hypothetical protein
MAAARVKEKRCDFCGGAITRRARESTNEFQRRRFCSRACFLRAPRRPAQPEPIVESPFVALLKNEKALYSALLKSIGIIRQRGEGGGFLFSERECLNFFMVTLRRDSEGAPSQKIRTHREKE